MNILLACFAKMVDDSGGLAKVTCAFAKEMYERGHRVTLVYSDDKEGKFFFDVPQEVQCYNLHHYKGQHILFPLSYKIKREILRVIDQRKGRAVNNEFTEKFLLDNVRDILQEVKPDVIVASQPAASKVLLSDLKINIPVITMSHGDPEDYFHTYPVKELPSLGLSVACQVLMPSFVKAIKQRFPQERVVVIGNSVPQHDKPVDLSKAKSTYKIICIGRLNKNHKRPHLLIEAFAKLAKDFPNWQVEMWGAEDKKKYTKKLRNIIAQNDLAERVFLKGTTNNVNDVLKQGDIFVFPSAYEGFGLTLAEAMSIGLPGIGYKNCSAVNELIQDGVNGLLADDGVDSLAEKMQQLMENQEMRARFGKAAHEAMKQYNSAIIWDEWEKLIAEVATCN